MSNTKELMARTLKELRQLRGEVDKYREAAKAPIAVVGMGLRFPGGLNNPEALWTALCEGRDMIVPTPKERWDNDQWFDADPDSPGKISTTLGGFLGEIDQFDAAFFEISPKEARHLDPQQRMILEVSWEALERAAIAPDTLYGKSTGVFFGICGFDYGMRMLENQDPEDIDAFCGTGSGLSVVAGRLSYFLGLTGPSMVVDTACSSSLVSMHLASQSLRSGECDLALAGGVNLILQPSISVNFSRAHLLAQDGRSKTFDASANGYGRAEGCGVIALKRLADAERDGDPIVAVIRGSAVNQDGASGGLTVPSGPSQSKVIRAAQKAAGLRPADIDYVEAHGTGTALGDPIEMGALGEVFHAERETPLYVGSIKTNMGHLEAAAGMAGFIKTALTLSHGTVPPNLHFDQPSPHIEWDRLPVKVPTETTALPAKENPHRAGISGFGFGGTNAHVIVEAPKAEAPRVVPAQATRVLTVSGKTSDALAQAVENLRGHLEAHQELNWVDVCHTQNLGRVHFDHRRAVVAASTEEAIAKLSKELPENKRVANRVAFVFDGTDTASAELGAVFYHTHPTYRATVDRCAEALKASWNVSLTDVLFGKHNDLLANPAYSGVALFVAQVALVDTLRASGLKPQYVAGFGAGQWAAAYTAGIMGQETALMSLKASLSSSMTDRLGQLMEEASLSQGGIPFINCQTGAVAGAEVATAQFWLDSAKRTANYDAVNATLKENEVKMAINLGTTSHVDALYVLPTFASEDAWTATCAIWADLYESGHHIEWPDAKLSDAGRRLALPTYPFQRERAWLDEKPANSAATGTLVRAETDIDALAKTVAREGNLNTDEMALLPKLLRLLAGRGENLMEAGLHYDVTWTEQPLAAADSAQGTWLLFADEGPVSAHLADALEEKGAAVRLVKAGTAYAVDGNTVTINPTNAADYTRLIEETNELAGAAHLWSLNSNAEGWDEATAATCLGLLHLRTALGEEKPLFLITQAAVSTHGEEEAPGIAHAPLWGLGKTFGLEYPGQQVLIDLPNGPMQGGSQLLARELLEADGEDQIALRPCGRWVARLTEGSTEEVAGLQISKEGAYLITGGLGYLGSELARWLADRGARHLVLTNRSALPARENWDAAQDTETARRIAAIRALEAAGVRVTVAQTDTTDQAAVNGLFAQLAEQQIQVRGIFHLAGVMIHRDNADLDEAALEQALAAKAKGAWVLHNASQQLALDCFVCFSSGSSIWGGHGLAAYGAANAYLDAFCRHRRACGQTAFAVNWGLVGQGGMGEAGDQEELAKIGLHVLQPIQAFQLMAQLHGNGPQAVVTKMDWPLFRSVYEARGTRPFLKALKTEDPSANGASEDTVLDQLLTTAPEQRLPRVVDYVRNRMAEGVGLDVARLDVDTHFTALGLNSLLAGQIQNRMRRDLDLDIPMALFLRDSTVTSLAEWLTDELKDMKPTAAAQEEVEVSALANIDLSAGVAAEDTGLLLENLDNLSDEEVQQLLASMNQG